jgi:N-acetylneuraminic acid mutarotase
MATARAQFGAAAGADGRIYAFGGINDTFNGSLDSLERYDPATDSWSTLAPLPIGRANHAAAAGADGRIYAIGGNDSNVEAYNPATNTWSAVAPLPTPRGFLAATTGADGRIYAVGGYGPLDTLEAYNPATNSWSTLAPMPTARSFLAAAAGADGRIYAIGGDNSLDGIDNPLNTVEAYNPATNSWSAVAPMPTARSLLAAARGPDGRIYAIGGSNDSHGDTLDSVERYDPATNTWSTVAPIPIARYDVGAATGADGRIYAIGGANHMIGFQGTYSTVTALSLVTVTPPPNQATSEGASTLFNLGSFTDDNPNANSWSVDVNWGDGTHTMFLTKSQGLLGSAFHTYEEGSYAASVKVTDNANLSDSATFQVSVSDPPVVVVPGKAFFAAEGTAFANAVMATFTDPAGPEANVNYGATIDWGDGTPTTAGTITQNGGVFTVNGSHNYGEEGSYLAKVTVTHDAAPFIAVMVSATVYDLAVTASANAFVAVEGAILNNLAVATFTDPAGPEAIANYSASIDWGDGTPPTAGAITVNGGVFTVSGSHTYGEEGSYLTKVTVTHEGMLPVTVMGSASVSDPAVVGALVNVNATAGAPFGGLVATFNDPGGSEPNASDPTPGIASHYTAVISWGDGTPSSTGTINFAGGVFSVSGNHTYAGAGPYTITSAINHEGIFTPVQSPVAVVNLGVFAQGPQSKPTSFWAGGQGQQLLNQFGLTSAGQTLGQWLATTLPNLYGGAIGAPNLSASSNAQVAAFYLTLFNTPNPPILDAEVMDTALNVFASTTSLGGGVAQGYGFVVNATGLGACWYNVGVNGQAFGVANFTALNVYQILQAANNSAMAGEAWNNQPLLRLDALNVFLGLTGG